MRPLVALGIAALGGVVAFRCLPRKSRVRLTAAMKRRMAEHMERMMARLPDNAPPRLVMSILPRLQAQNEQIISLLREQNELLRARQRAG
jgi:type II secretory pathway component PulJ